MKAFVSLLLVVLSCTILFGDEKKFKRLSKASDDDLRKQLLLAPEVGLDQSKVAVLYTLLKKTLESRAGVQLPDNLRPDIGPLFLEKINRKEFVTLPWRSGPDCQLGNEVGEQLQVLSTSLRTCLRQSVPAGDIRPNPETLRTLLCQGPTPTTRGRNTAKILSSEWNTTAALPALQQLLQAENAPVRLVMVDLLANIKDKNASVALAQRALFDLSSEVRQRAVQALSKRPVSHYRDTLLAGFRYPWQPVAEHAAEAVIALKMKDCVPDLVNLLKEPDPRLPFLVETKKGKNYLIRELVRMNHLCNCMVCHAPSLSKDDLVRGRVPVPNENPPPAYYAERTGNFVRADITFIKQDFSVLQPVVNNGKWPGIQRYDYLIRLRQPTAKELNLYRQLPEEKRLSNHLAQESLLFALKELSGKNLGNTYQEWMPLLTPIRKEGTLINGDGN